VDDAARRATRERVILALVPTCSRHEMRNPKEIVDIATELCKYIDNVPIAGTTQQPQGRGPKGK